MAKQESGKTAFPTFGPSFESSFANMQSTALCSRYTITKNHPPKHKGKVAETAQADAEEVMM